MHHRYLINNRLAWFDDQSPMDWDKHWAQHIRLDMYPENSGLGIMYLFKDFLPTQGKILEAGCGTAQLVHGMRQSGYDCEGVDNAVETIAQINRIKPDLPVRVDDVLNLDVPDGHYAGYVSLGVVEHRFEGPEPFFKEAHRVLAPGGVAIFTVPFFSPLRKLKAAVGCFSGKPTKKEFFYQYALSREEMTSMLRAHHFSVEALRYYAAWKGVKDEFPPLQWLNRRKSVATAMGIWCERQAKLMPSIAHMLALVCRRN